MSELKACPFCGCIPSLKQYDDEGLIGLVCPVGSACRDTGLAMAFIHEQKDTAIAAWNTRASDAELAKLRAEIAELRNLLDELDDSLQENRRTP
jgi:Lar family restriction alleviation protein